jgi:hypothetical protein
MGENINLSVIKSYKNILKQDYIQSSPLIKITRGNI